MRSYVPHTSGCRWNGVDGKRLDLCSLLSFPLSQGTFSHGLGAREGWGGTRLCPTPCGSGGAQEMALLSWAWERPWVLSLRPPAVVAAARFTQVPGAGRDRQTVGSQARQPSRVGLWSQGRSSLGGLSFLVCRQITPTCSLGARPWEEAPTPLLGPGGRPPGFSLVAPSLG